MRQEFWLPILVVILALACPTIVQAQQPDAATLEDNAIEDLDQLHDRSEKGDAVAQYELAEQHRLGLSVEQDYAKAIELYNRSAGQGNALSQFRLGELYEEGDILERDLGKAIESYQKAAEQGHSGAQYALAHIYHLGSGVAQDMAAAMVWYRKAALQGDEWSQLALGDQYRIGLAVPRDLVQSTKWYRMAAEQGNIFAQYELGNAYRYGNGVDSNIAQAIEWYRLSAEAGNPSAKLALAELQSDGTTAERVAAQAPEPEVGQDAGSQEFKSAWEADLSSSKTDKGASETDHANLLLPELEEAPQSASLAPASGAAAPGTELAYALEPSYRDEEVVSQLLARAENQAAKLALTTPERDNAYETYQSVLSLQPNNEAALAGIEQIGVKYVELANLAAAKGDLRKANHYAEKATELAPEHPLVQAMAIPMQVDRPTIEETILTSATLADIKTLRRAPAALQEATAKAEMPIGATDSALSKSLIEDTDDLVFEPHHYQGRQVVVTGSVVWLFWRYRLKSETGQNSIVIDVDGLRRADRAELEAAIEKAGFLGQVRARIKGRIEPQGMAIFQLAASELVLVE